MTRLADRTNWIDSSGIRKVFSLAAELKDPINLSIGQPDFDVPETLKEVAHQAIEKGHNRYTLTKGLPALRTKLLERHPNKPGVRDNDDVIVVSGASGGLLLSFMALFNPGDEVLVPDPYFVMYKHLLNLLGIKPVFVNTYPDFSLPIDKLAAAVTDKTRGIIVNSPANPTGTVYTKAQLQAVVDLATKRDLVMISDEIYDSFCYDSTYTSLADLAENVVLIGGFSKSVAMTGWRLGYVIAPKDLVQAMEEIQQYTFVCAPSVAQHMGIAALDMDRTEICRQYARKRDMLYEGVRNYYEVIKPGGAFYMFLKAPGGDAQAFVKTCIANNLLCVPGDCFSEHNTHFRLSYAATDETIQRGIEVLQRLAKQA